VRARRSFLLGAAGAVAAASTKPADGATGRPTTKPSAPTDLADVPKTSDDLSSLYKTPETKLGLRFASAGTQVFGDVEKLPTHLDGDKGLKELMFQRLRDPALGLAADDPMPTWAETFSSTFDRRARRIVVDTAAALADPTQFGPGRDPPYTTHLYDVWLRSAAGLLDRCLAYRREMGQYEVQGIYTAINYVHFATSGDIANSLLEVGDLSEVEHIRQASSNKAARKFAEAWDVAPLAKGEAIQSDGAARVAAMMTGKESDKKIFLGMAFNAAAEVQLAKFAASVTPGSATNWAERYLRLLALLKDDLGEAFMKCYCAGLGVAQVLEDTTVRGLHGDISVVLPLEEKGIDAWMRDVLPHQGGDGASTLRVDDVNSNVLNDPKIRRIDVLDALVIWVRALMRHLDRVSQYESEVTVSIPLNALSGVSKSPILPNDFIATAKAKLPLRDAELGIPASDALRFDFKLTEKHLPTQVAWARLRVIGVGLSLNPAMNRAVPINYADADLVDPKGHLNQAVGFQEPRLDRFNAVIHTPEQQFENTGKKYKYRRPAVVLANVRMQGGANGDLEPMIVSDASIRGTKFTDSNWTIRLDLREIPWFSTVERGQQGADQLIRGFILHLRIRGIPTIAP
jgi:hypothetical protein